MLIWLAVIVVTVFLDQLTKYLTILYLKPIDTLPIIEDVLHLTYVENTGAAFGMMKDQRWVFMTVSAVAIVALLAYLFIKKPQSKLECLSLAFIIGGGIGNMIDRVGLGYVVDMIDFRLIHFAVFNVADSFVCVGAGLMLLWLLLSIVKESREEKAAKARREAEDGETEASADDTAEGNVEDVAEDTLTDESGAEPDLEEGANEPAAEDAPPQEAENGPTTGQAPVNEAENEPAEDAPHD